jgi:thiol:disulfide interchange protein
MTPQNQNTGIGLINYKKGFKIHFLFFLLGIPAIWIIWSLTDRTYPWALWQTIGWSVGILFHFLGVYVFKKSKLN